MSETLMIQEQKDLEMFTESIAKQLASGRRQSDVVKELVMHGWAEEDANPFVNKMVAALNENRIVPGDREVDEDDVLLKEMLGDDSDFSPAQNRQLSKKYFNKMISGGLWAFGGSAVTIFTMMSGDTFVLAWGAIIYGFIDFFRGVAGWQKHKV